MTRAGIWCRIRRLSLTVFRKRLWDAPCIPRSPNWAFLSFVQKIMGTETSLFGRPGFRRQEGKNDLRAQREASCKAQAAMKFSAIHFIKRSQFVNNCMGATTTAKKDKRTPSTTGQRTM
jgi:hypothetical protein